jgi:hypothetical protein
VCAEANFEDIDDNFLRRELRAPLQGGPGDSRTVIPQPPRK